MYGLLSYADPTFKYYKKRAHLRTRIYIQYIYIYIYISFTNFKQFI